ncbi:MAG: penicillin-binding protein activator, partial [Chitinispirillia bacterium]|nr:penicillin-binding protein activator [Chitinispirillia bacterium]
PPPAANGGSPLFRKARDFYAAGQYDSTIVLIREHLRKNTSDPESYILVPLISEAYMRKGENVMVHRLIDKYRQNFPDSPFIPRLTYLEGVAYGRLAKPAQALTSFSNALSLGISPDLFNLTLSNTEKLCELSLSADELSTLSSKDELHAVLLEIVRFFEIRKLETSGQSVRAKNSAEEFRAMYPRSRYIDQVKEFQNKFTKTQQQKGGAGPVQAGLLAPMTGEDAQIGQYILQGVKLAIDNHNARSHNHIKLIVYDTKGSAVETAKKSKELVTKDQAQLCIGPILSHTAAVSAAMFSGKDIVMITPTANEDGISSIDDNIFQMNVTIGAMARKLAKYALDNLNIREFAIIAPNTVFGYAMADAFKDELAKRSIEVVHEEYFQEGKHDFSQELRRLRYKLICRRLEAISAERGEMRRVTQLTRSDSLRYADTTFAVGGLFMPLSEYEDVVKLAPQVVFQRIRTQMLGTGRWDDPRVPSEGKRYVHDAIISIGTPHNQDSEEWKKFSSAYRARFNSDANRIAAMGYDAAQLVIKAVTETGGTDAVKLRKAVAAVQDYSGLSGKVSFDPQTGANSEVLIMKVTENGLVRVH